jgi:predicted DsbA family dithiol-disulfide isomerase
LGAVFPTAAFERTNKLFALLNFFGVSGLLVYSVFIFGSLDLLYAGYFLFALSGLFLFWRYGIDHESGGFVSRWFRPSFKLVMTFGVVALVGATGFFLFTAAKREGPRGVDSTGVVEKFFSLPEVEWPSVISPYMYHQSTEKFEDAPVQVIYYGDFLCPDCMYLCRHMERLKEEFEGKINVAFQFFPLEAKCNDVVDKDSHPGACDISYMAAYDPSKFQQIQKEIQEDFPAAKKPEWRADLAKRYGVEAALHDERTKELVHRIIETGAEYEKSSDRWTHGIRSTPTMIVNKRMVIGTYPYSHLRAIFKALIDRDGRVEEDRKKYFMENWVPTSALGR